MKDNSDLQILDGEFLSKNELKSRLVQMDVDFDNQNQKKNYFVKLYNNSLKDVQKKKKILDRLMKDTEDYINKQSASKRRNREESKEKESEADLKKKAKVDKTKKQFEEKVGAVTVKLNDLTGITEEDSIDFNEKDKANEISTKRVSAAGVKEKLSLSKKKKEEQIKAASYVKEAPDSDLQNIKNLSSTYLNKQVITPANQQPIVSTQPILVPDRTIRQTASVATTTPTPIIQPQSTKPSVKTLKITRRGTEPQSSETLTNLKKDLSIIQEEDLRKQPIVTTTTPNTIITNPFKEKPINLNNNKEIIPQPLYSTKSKDNNERAFYQPRQVSSKSIPNVYSGNNLPQVDTIITPLTAYNQEILNGGQVNEFDLTATANLANNGQERIYLKPPNTGNPDLDKEIERAILRDYPNVIRVNDFSEMGKEPARTQTAAAGTGAGSTRMPSIPRQQLTVDFNNRLPLFVEKEHLLETSSVISIFVKYFVAASAVVIFWYGLKYAIDNYDFSSILPSFSSPTTGPLFSEQTMIETPTTPINDFTEAFSSTTKAAEEQGQSFLSKALLWILKRLIVVPVWNTIKSKIIYVLLIFALKYMLTRLYRAYKNNRNTSKIYKEIKKRLQVLSNNCSDIEVGISEDQIIQEYAIEYDYNTNDFKDNVFPKLKEMRKNDPNIREFETFFNGRMKRLWQWNTL